jgi:putative methanogenesis marker protein 17
VEIFIESEQNEIDGLKAYYALIEDVSKDLNAFNIIRSVRVFVDLSSSLFVLALNRKFEVKKIKVNEICKVKKIKDRVEIEILEEKYSPELVTLLFQEFGHENVNQKERLLLEITNVDEEAIQKFVYSSFIPLDMQHIEDIIVEFASRIIPIGFYARKRTSFDDLDVFIAAERTITQRDLERTKEILSKPPKKLKFEENLIEEGEFKYVPYKDELM